ncbi:sulfite exporter TauE/SafE family protein [Aestuariivirga sp.]|uniref:sulfite exporter TauE/SafE family protein n=1 Tax=Aestuariivirga sp. TaxID=2650926 RepID=UPI003BA96474
MPLSFEHLSVLTLVLTILVAGVAGTARGFSGFGAALIFMPAASALVGPAVAAPVLLVADGILSLGFLPRAWRLARRRDVGLMAAGAIIGVPLGAFILDHADPLTLRWVIAALASSMLLLLASGWRYHGTPRPGVTAVIGGVAGLFGGLAQMTGPPVVAYWLSGKESHGTMRASIILFFGATTVFTFVSYLFAGLITAQSLWLAAMVAPAYALGLFVGARAFHLASPVLFRRLCFALIAASVAMSLPIWR